MLYFDIAGSCAAIGEGIGEHFKQRIKDYVDYRYQQMHDEFADLMIEFVRSEYYIISNSLIRYAGYNAKHELDELKGVSRATNLPIEDILFAVGYTDIFDLMLSQKGVLRPNLFNFNAECTTFIYKKSEKIYCGQNWDMDEGSANNCCYFKKRYSDGVAIQGLSTVIGLIHIGVNERGTFIGTANLCSQRNTPNGLIFPMTIQHLLRDDVSTRSLNWLKAVKKVGGHYFYVMQGHKYSYAIECNSDECSLHEISGVYAHSNHYRENALKKSGIVYSSDTVLRCNYLEKELVNQNIGVDAIKVILSDHTNNICRHNDGGYAQTCASIIYDVNNYMIYLCDSNPCSGTWRTEQIEIK